METSPLTEAQWEPPFILPTSERGIRAMHFRLTLDLAFYLSFSDETLEVEYPGRTPIRVVIRRRMPDEQGADLSEADALAVATTQRRDKDRLSDAFEALKDRRLPAGSTIPIEDNDLVGPDGRIAGRGYRWEWLPEWLRAYLKDVSGDLGGAIQRTARLTRWLTGADSPHNPVRSFRAWEASADGQTWINLPGQLSARLGSAAGVHITDRVRAEMTRLVADPDLIEPLGHELRREAERQIGGNPRSAIIMTIAAAEAGIKEFITRANRETAWLIENMPSPPIERLLTDYLPLILREQGVRDSDLRLPERLVETLRNGVARRNKVAHGINVPTDADAIEQVLVAVTDVLWILD